jgi:exodeoxyribonuclease VII large subunit
MAVPVRQELLLTLLDMYQRITVALTRWLSAKAETLTNLARGLPHPRRYLDLAAQRLDDWSERLRAAPPSLLNQKNQQLAVASAKLQPKNLAQNLSRHIQDIVQYAERMERGIQRIISDRSQKLASILQLLESLNYKRVLERGFVLVREDKGKLVTRAKNMKDAQHTLVFFDGEKKVTSS